VLVFMAELDLWQGRWATGSGSSGRQERRQPWHGGRDDCQYALRFAVGTISTEDQFEAAWPLLTLKPKLLRIAAGQ